MQIEVSMLISVNPFQTKQLIAPGETAEASSNSARKKHVNENERKH